MADLPLVSVLIPAYRAQASLAQAVASVLNAGLSPDLLEILVESDDGEAYPELAALPSVAVQVSGQVTGQVATGVGPTRNRALARARGRFVTYLDADDLFAPDWLSAILPLALRDGAAASSLLVEEAGRPILRLWDDASQLDYEKLSRSGASARGLFARELCPPFADALSQDILHLLEVMRGRGAVLALSPLPYHLRLTPQSVTAADDFSSRVHAAYLAHIARLGADTPEAQVFKAKIALNAAYMKAGEGRSYYGFIAERLSRAERP